jgi:uncharacterized protein (DUF1330 family)
MSIPIRSGSEQNGETEVKGHQRRFKRKPRTSASPSTPDISLHRTAQSGRIAANVAKAAEALLTLLRRGTKRPCCPRTWRGRAAPPPGPRPALRPRARERRPGRIRCAREAYTRLAVPAVLASGGRYLARGDPAKTHEGGIDQRTVVVEFDSLAQAISAYDGPGYQAALAVLGNAAERDLRILEGVDG